MAENGKFVYRISTAKEWDELQNKRSTLGGERDKSRRFIHLSKLEQVQSSLRTCFLDTKDNLYLLQIDVEKLGEGLIYEVVDGVNSFPRFYGGDRSFSPLPLDSVVRAEKLSFSDGHFTCSFLNRFTCFDK